ncbi:MAG TPA: Holliday junction branch migration protein RuvA [Bacilli bacterium]
MIDFLKGNVVFIENDYIVMDVNGVGYRVFCANPQSFSSLNETPTKVFIYHNVREDAILLFGFPTREEQALFRRLLDVSGIGPRVALGILSGGRPESVIAAIQQENLAFLTKLPGIGMKTAQRMILDLKDKLGAVIPLQSKSPDPKGVHLAPDNRSNGSNWEDAKAGLIALGYSDAEIDLVRHGIKAQVKETDSPEVLIKTALKALYVQK